MIPDFTLIWPLSCLKDGVHLCSCWLLLAEGHLTRRLFGDMLRRIWALPVTRRIAGDR